MLAVASATKCSTEPEGTGGGKSYFCNVMYAVVERRHDSHIARLTYTAEAMADVLERVVSTCPSPGSQVNSARDEASARLSQAFWSEKVCGPPRGAELGLGSDVSGCRR
jgi:hypothetical protein